MCIPSDDCTKVQKDDLKVYILVPSARLFRLIDLPLSCDLFSSPDDRLNSCLPCLCDSSLTMILLLALCRYHRLLSDFSAVSSWGAARQLAAGHPSDSATTTAALMALSVLGLAFCRYCTRVKGCPTDGPRTSRETVAVCNFCAPRQRRRRMHRMGHPTRRSHLKGYRCDGQRPRKALLSSLRNAA